MGDFVLDPSTFSKAVEHLDEGIARYQTDTCDTQIRDGLIQRFKFTYGISHKMLVWALGSRATGTAKPFPDLDLVVITEQPLSLDLSAHLSEDFPQSNLPWKVDVVDWATTSDVFRAIIARDKVVIQQPTAQQIKSEPDRVSCKENL